MIYVPNQSKKLTTLLQNNGYKEGKTTTAYVYMLNNKNVVETHAKTTIFGQSKLEIDKNIFKDLQKIAEIRDTKYTQQSKDQHCITDNKTGLTFCCVNVQNKTANIGHVRINDVFRGTYIFCNKYDAQHIAKLVLPHCKEYKTYKSTTDSEEAAYEDVLLQLVRDDIQK